MIFIATVIWYIVITPVINGQPGKAFEDRRVEFSSEADCQDFAVRGVPQRLAEKGLPSGTTATTQCLNRTRE